MSISGCVHYHTLLKRECKYLGLDAQVLILGLTIHNTTHAIEPKQTNTVHLYFMIW